MLQAMLEGVPLPAQKSELIRYARAQGDHVPIDALERLPDRQYRSLDEVGEALAPVQPETSDEAPLPHEEGDRPPGGDDYVNPSPWPGGVRQDAPPENPPQKAIEEQTRRQKEQKERQEQQLGPPEG